LAGLAGIIRRRGFKTTVRDRDGRVTPALVERRFIAEKPDQLWVEDITYIPTWRGWLYLAIVLAAYSRCIVGWAMGHICAQNSC
jgi:putative transposase